MSDERQEAFNAGYDWAMEMKRPATYASILASECLIIQTEGEITERANDDLETVLRIKPIPQDVVSERKILIAIRGKVYDLEEFTAACIRVRDEIRTSEGT